MNFTSALEIFELYSTISTKFLEIIDKIFRVALFSTKKLARYSAAKHSTVETSVGEVSLLDYVNVNSENISKNAKIPL